MPSLLFDGEIITVCIMVALWLVPLKHRSCLHTIASERLRPGLKFKLSRRFTGTKLSIATLCVTEIRGVSQGFEGKKGEKAYIYDL